ARKAAQLSTRDRRDDGGDDLSGPVGDEVRLRWRCPTEFSVLAEVSGSIGGFPEASAVIVHSAKAELDGASGPGGAARWESVPSQSRSSAAGWGIQGRSSTPQRGRRNLYRRPASAALGDVLHARSTQSRERSLSLLRQNRLPAGSRL